MSENDPIREYQNKMQQACEDAERLRPIVKSCGEAIERAGVIASISVQNTPPQVHLVVLIKQLKDTIPLFRELAKEGLRTDKNDKPEDQKAFEVMAIRKYKMGPQLSVIAMMFPTEKEGEPTCRMVQTGVKEVPVYEMQCEE